jgi:hypothetical protein
MGSSELTAEPFLLTWNLGSRSTCSGTVFFLSLDVSTAMKISGSLTQVLEDLLW